MKSQPSQPSSLSLARANSGLYPRRRPSPSANDMDADPPAKRQCSVSPSRPALRRSTPTDAVNNSVASTSASVNLADHVSCSPTSCPYASAARGLHARTSPANVSRSWQPPSGRSTAVFDSALAPPRGPIDPAQRALLEPEYRDDVRTYMAEMELKTLPSVELIDMQPELQWYMRPYLVDFLIEVHQQHMLRQETLYLAMNIVDRYVSRRIVFKKLVGCAALWIAAKFEDAKDRVPTVHDLIEACCKAYEDTAFTQMEGHVLSTIGWVIGHPTAEAWLRSTVVTPFAAESLPVQHVARYLMEITLFYRQFVACKSSDVANAALLLARHIVNMPAGQATIIANETEKDALAVAQALDDQLREHLDQISTIVVRKYHHQFYSKASTLVQEWYLSGRRLAVRAADQPPTPQAHRAFSSPVHVSSKSQIPPSTPTSCMYSSEAWRMTSSPQATASAQSSPSSASSIYDQGDLGPDEIQSDCDEPITPITPMSYISIDPLAIKPVAPRSHNGRLAVQGSTFAPPAAAADDAMQA